MNFGQILENLWPQKFCFSLFAKFPQSFRFIFPLFLPAFSPQTWACFVNLFHFEKITLKITLMFFLFLSSAFSQSKERKYSRKFMFAKCKTFWQFFTASKFLLTKYSAPKVCRQFFPSHSIIYIMLSIDLWFKWLKINRHPLSVVSL